MTDRIPASDLRKFVDLMITFGKVERMYYFPGTGRKENDQEHSYLLAMTAWYLIQSNKLSLNLEKVLTYALAHDIVEIFAGDTYVYTTDTEYLSGKEGREAEAAQKLIQELPQFAQMHESIEGYVKREDPESRFVYALDKILPLLLIHADNGRSWKEHGVTLEMLISNKTPKVALSPEIQPYFDELVAMLKQEEKEIF